MLFTKRLLRDIGCVAAGKGKKRKPAQKEEASAKKENQHKKKAWTWEGECTVGNYLTCFNREIFLLM